MRIIAFSDIHGNYENLVKVLNAIKSEQADQVFFLGDILTKGPDGIKCLDLLMENHVACCYGNAELYVNKGIDMSTPAAKYKEFYDDLNEKLSDEEKKFIANMPLCFLVEFRHQKIYFSHFLVKEEKAYFPFYSLDVLKTDEFDHLLEKEEKDLLVFGHRHEEAVRGKALLLPAVYDEPTYVVIDVDKEIHYEFRHVE